MLAVYAQADSTYRHTSIQFELQIHQYWLLSIWKGLTLSKIYAIHRVILYMIFNQPTLPFSK